MAGFENVAEAVTENGKTWKSWVMIAAILLTWTVSAAVQWGFNSAHQVETDRRLEMLESSQHEKMDRSEFVSWQQYLDKRLDRMEGKIDTIVERK